MGSGGGGARSWLYRGCDNNCHWTELISSNVNEVSKRDGSIFMQKKDIFLGYLGPEFFDFSLSFFFFFFFKISSE